MFRLVVSAWILANARHASLHKVATGQFTLGAAGPTAPSTARVWCELSRFVHELDVERCRLASVFAGSEVAPKLLNLVEWLWSFRVSFCAHASLTARNTLHVPVHDINTYNKEFGAIIVIDQCGTGKTASLTACKRSEASRDGQ